MERLQIDVNELKQCTNKILVEHSLRGHGQLNENNEIDFPSLPLKDEDDLASVEAWLDNDNNCRALVRKTSYPTRRIHYQVYISVQAALLSKIGGSNFKKTVYNILQKMFEHELARRVRFTEQSGKVGFKDKKLRKVVVGKLLVATNK